MEARRRLEAVMSKQLILFLLAGAAMAQSGGVEQTVVWQRARTSAPAHTYTAASKPAAEQPAADQKVASAQSSPTDPEVVEAVRWERAKDRAAQRQIAKSKKK